MDLNSAYTQGGISASLIFGGGILYKIYRSVNGKRVRCKCCGYDLEADFKVDDMPPSPPIERFTNPMVDAAQVDKSRPVQEIH